MHDKDITPRNAEGEPHGHWKTHHQNGKLSEGQYVNGLKQGVWADYNSIGRIICKDTYVNGIVNGYSEIYLDSKICWEGYYKNTELSGYWKKYDNKGNFEYAEFFAQ